jgi:hypothetical protein
MEFVYEHISYRQNNDITLIQPAAWEDRIYLLDSGLRDKSQELKHLARLILFVAHR